MRQKFVSLTTLLLLASLVLSACGSASTGSSGGAPTTAATAKPAATEPTAAPKPTAMAEPTAAPKPTAMSEPTAAPAATVAGKPMARPTAVTLRPPWKKWRTTSPEVAPIASRTPISRVRCATAKAMIA